MSLSPSPGPAMVFWVMSRMHRRTAPGSRLQAPGPDRCKHGLTAHRGTVPNCPHLAHKQPRRQRCGPGDRQHWTWLEASREGKGRERGGESGGGENREGKGKRAGGNDFMLVRAVHNSEKKKKSVASRLTCLNTVYILLFLLFAVPNCGSCHQWGVHSGGTA